MSNTKDIKDYLHFFIGCEVEYDDGFNVVRRTLNKELLWEISLDKRTVKPILRSLNSMTEDEHRGYYLAMKEGRDSGLSLMSAHAESTRYLLSLHFDLFDLINSGIALEKQQEVKK